MRDGHPNAAENILYGPTMGDVATLVIMPAVSSHRNLPKEERLKPGIEDFEIIKEEFGTAPGSASAL